MMALTCFILGCETISAFKSGDLVMDDVDRMLKLERGTGIEEKPVGPLGFLRKSDVWVHTNLW